MSLPEQSARCPWDVTEADRRIQDAFMLLTPRERQCLTAALAGNHPADVAHLREPLIRGLTLADIHAPHAPSRKLHNAARAVVDAQQRFLGAPAGAPTLYRSHMLSQEIERLSEVLGEGCSS